MNGNLYLIMFGAAALVLLRAIRNMHRPVKGGGFRILLPLFFMLPGLMLIMNPAAQPPAWMMLSAAGLGILLSLPLIYTTGYEVREDGKIYAKVNFWFVAAFLAVLAVRFALRSEMQTMDANTKAALFMTIAFCCIIPWRVTSYVKYRKTAVTAQA